jgi:multiple sugar transport system permease protein
MATIAERQVTPLTEPAPTTGARPKSSYWPFVVPAVAVVGSVIVFPWAFTVWMSLQEWTVGGARRFTGLSNYMRLVSDERFLTSVGHTLVYTFLAVVLPLIFGTFAALIFNSRLPFRGVLRGVFVMPMMATPVAVALVWTMMFHPQLGVLNYLLSLVETWQWTPLVMLIVLGGLAAIPIEPYESAAIDGANVLQRFRYITLPMIAPFLMVAVIIRTIDALKSFDIIYAITQGGPGTASETINLYLYSVAFAYYDVGYGSAIAVVFFAIVIALSLLMLHLRQRTKWIDIQG